MSDSGIASAWLRAETPEHLRVLTRLRERLVKRLDAADTKGSTEVPDRDWCRALQRYQAGYGLLLTAETERQKLALMAQLKGGAVITDEEYNTGIRELGIEALRQLPAADLAAELERRGLKLPAGTPENERGDDGDE